MRRQKGLTISVRSNNTIQLRRQHTNGGFLSELDHLPEGNASRRKLGEVGNPVLERGRMSVTKPSRGVGAARDTGQAESGICAPAAGRLSSTTCWRLRGIPRFPKRLVLHCDCSIEDCSSSQNSELVLVEGVRRQGHGIGSKV